MTMFRIFNKMSFTNEVIHHQVAVTVNTKNKDFSLQEGKNKLENPEIDRLLKNWLINLRGFANLLREFMERKSSPKESKNQKSRRNYLKGKRKAV